MRSWDVLVGWNIFDNDYSLFGSLQIGNTLLKVNEREKTVLESDQILNLNV